MTLLAPLLSARSALRVTQGARLEGASYAAKAGGYRGAARPLIKKTRGVVLHPHEWIKWVDTSCVHPFYCLLPCCVHMDVHTSGSFTAALRRRRSFSGTILVPAPGRRFSRPGPSHKQTSE